MADNPPVSPLSPTTPGHSWSISTATCRRQHMNEPLNTGLALPAFDDDFDMFFEVKSDFMENALAGHSPRHAEQRCDSIPEFKSMPSHWGLKIDTLHLFWDYVRADAQGYASAHYIDEEFHHVCLSSPCEWHHHDHKMRVSASDAKGTTAPMKVNMHLITSRYAKPWTQRFPDAEAGLALVMNTARLCDRPGPTAEELCKAQIFISHCWDELSVAFFGTLARDFDAERIVWVCSFALDQNGHVSDALKHVELTPFYRALEAAESITTITDATCEVFDRVWCVLEAHLALTMDKPFNMLLWEDDNHEIWHHVAGKLAHIDVHDCNATVPADKVLILEYCDEHLESVNTHLREISRGAVLQAELRSFAKEGDLGELFKRMDLEELRRWKTGKRHRTLTHLFAVYQHVPQLLEFSKKADHEQLDVVDIDGRTPLSLACEEGEMATVNALVTLRASVNIASKHGLLPMHYAAENGHRPVVHILKEHGTDIKVRGTFKGEKDHTPMSVAISSGNHTLVRDFLSWKGDSNHEVEGGMPVLHLASKWGHTRIVAALVAADVDVNKQTTNGRTALMHAAQCGHASVVSVLGWHADLAPCDQDGLTVNDFVEECRHDHPLEADDIEYFLKMVETRLAKNSSSLAAAVPMFRRNSPTTLGEPVSVTSCAEKAPVPVRSKVYASDPFAEKAPAPVGPQVYALDPHAEKAANTPVDFGRRFFAMSSCSESSVASRQATTSVQISAYPSSARVVAPIDSQTKRILPSPIPISSVCPDSARPGNVKRAATVSSMNMGDDSQGDKMGVRSSMIQPALVTRGISSISSGTASPLVRRTSVSVSRGGLEDGMKSRENYESKYVDFGKRMTMAVASMQLTHSGGYSALVSPQSGPQSVQPEVTRRASTGYYPVAANHSIAMVRTSSTPRTAEITNSTRSVYPHGTPR